MPHLAIVTYTRNQETLTPALIEIGNQISKRYSGVILELYSDSDLAASASSAKFPVHQNCFHGTKYRKLLHALKTTQHDYILSLDNDITANIPALLRLVEVTLSGRFDLGWGRINSCETENFISRLVGIDKVLSHNLLRPTLWRFHVGVTIPGQCFLLKASEFRDKLPCTDTFLDDLSIGLHAAKNKLTHFCTKDVVAYEAPSDSFVALWKQRARWAIGFKQTLSCPTLTREDRHLLWIHAFSYHILPLIHFFFLTFLFAHQPLFFAAWLIFTALMLAKNRPESLAAALSYPLIFPLFHFGWLINLLRIKL